MNKQAPPPKTISWASLEFIPHPKSPAWYLTFFVIAGGLMIFAILSKSIITILTFVLLIVVSYFFAVKNPKQVKNELTPLGIRTHNIFYPYKNIKAFWLVYDPPEVKTLNFETTAYLNNTVSVELGDQDPVAVKLFLSNYLLEDLDREESLTEQLTRKIKF